MPDEPVATEAPAAEVLSGFPPNQRQILKAILGLKCAADCVDGSIRKIIVDETMFQATRAALDSENIITGEKENPIDKSSSNFKLVGIKIEKREE